MAEAFAESEIPVPPDEVWQFIGGFGSPPRFGHSSMPSRQEFA